MEASEIVSLDVSENVTRYMDVGCQTGIELLWDLLDSLKKDGSMVKSKRKDGKIVQYTGETADGDGQISCLHFLSVEQDDENQSQDNTVVDAQLAELFGNTEGDENDEDYRPSPPPPKRGRGRPRGSKKKPGERTIAYGSARGKNLLAAENQAKKLLIEFLEKQGRSIDFFNYIKSELSEILASFYSEWLTEYNFQSGSIRSYACGLRRLFLREGFGPTDKLDIKFDPEFEVANNALRSAIEVVETLKAQGLSVCQVTVADIAKIYLSGVLRTDTPEGLLNKVIFETILLVKDIQVSDLFGITLNQVTKSTDENFREYYQFAGSQYRLVKSESPYCPFASMEKFIAKHPKDMNAKRWQYQTRLFLMPDPDFQGDEDAIFWYGFSPVGKNPMRTFMERISDCVGLSKTYTNVDLRTTLIENWQTALEVISEDTTSGVITVTPMDTFENQMISSPLSAVEPHSEEVETPSEISVTVDASGEMSMVVSCVDELQVDVSS